MNISLLLTRLTSLNNILHFISARWSRILSALLILYKTTHEMSTFVFMFLVCWAFFNSENEHRACPSSVDLLLSLVYFLLLLLDFLIIFARHIYISFNYFFIVVVVGVGYFEFLYHVNFKAFNFLKFVSKQWRVKNRITFVFIRLAYQGLLATLVQYKAIMLRSLIGV